MYVEYMYIASIFLCVYQCLIDSVKRDLVQGQKRPSTVRVCSTVSKETYYSVKRDLVQCQKRPSTGSKET
jgi:hypothetical protein